MEIKILAVGDVCGDPGLQILEKKLKPYRQENSIAFTVVNGENANVVGITPKQADMILRSGADVVTLGNHTWTRTELQPYLDERRKILRPANFGPQCPGRGIAAYHMPFGDVCVLNLMGRFTLDSNTDNPFVIADGFMEEIQEKIILVDFHAEGTSEKRAMGYLLDGKASAVWGTHTHVQTADEAIIHDCAFITDAGMCGAYDSIIGREINETIESVIHQECTSYTIAQGDAMFCGVIIEFDETTKKPVWIKRIQIRPQIQDE